MFRIVSTIACALSLLIHSGLRAEQGPVGPAPSTLKVLYAGKPDSPRMKEFVAFLEEHFAKVGTHDLETSFAEAAKDYDVVIIDWPPVYPRDEHGKMDMSNPNLQLAMPKIAIDSKFSKPIVMIGAAAGQIILQQQQVHLALDWKCLCLENYAHDTDQSHPIFRGPLPVALQTETIKEPGDYFTYPGTQKLGEEISVWKVQQKTFPVVDPGLVSSRERLESSSDAEAISGGINGKGPTSVAIGRHGNYLLWGFSAPPSEMTDAARVIFVNAICYMDAFDDRVPKPSWYSPNVRDEFLISVYHLRLRSPECIADAAKEMKQKMADSNLPPEAAAAFADPEKSMKDMAESFAAHILEKIPAEIQQKFQGNDAQNSDEQIIAYYTDNYDYLRPEGKTGSYVVDEQVKELGISNQDVALVDRCIEMLASADKSELAVELLNRYVDYKAKSAEKWSLWLKKNRNSLRFDGFAQRFVVAPQE